MSNDTEQTDIDVTESMGDFSGALTQLNELDVANDPDYDPEAQEAEKQAEVHAEQARIEFDQKTAQFTALMGLGMLENAFQMLLHPRFSFDDRTRAEAIEKFAPMLIKYGALFPEWLMQYKEEIEAGKAAVGLISSSYKQVKTLRAEDMALEAANDENAERAA